ncbi:putative lysophospholipase [Trichinella pseudospiralis]
MVKIWHLLISSIKKRCKVIPKVPTLWILFPGRDEKIQLLEPLKFHLTLIYGTKRCLKLRLCCNESSRSFFHDKKEAVIKITTDMVDFLDMF